MRALVAFRADDDFGVGEAYDLSTTGIFVVTHHEVPMGASVELKLRVEGVSSEETLVVRGDVVRSATTPGPDAHARGFAVHFSGSEPEVLARIRGLVLASTLRTQYFGDRTGRRLEGDDGAGRYDILNLLGTGATSDVFRARDRELDKIVALKVLKPHVAADEEFVARLSREAELVRRILSDRVVKVLASGLFHGFPCISMEYVEGMPMSRMLFERSLIPEDEVVGLALDVTEGLAAAHRLEIVHRDLKPSNVIVTPDGRAKVLDFGIARARLEMRLTQPGTFVGTPIYSPPEQLVGATASPRTDLYALGCVMFRALTGHDFQGSEDIPGILARQRSRESASLRSVNPDVSEGLDAIVSRCLALDPADRFADAGALHEALTEHRNAVLRVRRRTWRRRALVGEKDPEEAGRIQEVLMAERFDVRWIDDGYRLIEVALGARADLIVVAADLPTVDGLEAIQILRNSPRTAGTPLILVSSAESDGKVVTFLDAATFARKPIVVDELKSAVRQAFERTAPDPGAARRG